MFDFVRQHNKIMQILLFLLIFPSFVMFGIQGYSRYKDKGEAVASVAGHDISQSELENVHRQQIERMRAAMPTADVKLFDTPEAKKATLERMIRERLLAEAAQQLHLNVSDQRLSAELRQDPNIASLRRPDGALDLERYRQLLASQGMTPESFEARVRAELASRQVMSGVGESSFAPMALADVTLNAFYEQRQIQVARFTAVDYASRIQPTQEDLERYYNAHSAQFQSPERADVEYVVLDLASVQKGIVVPEAELKSFYEQNLARLASQEERRVSHILIAVDKSAPAAQREQARAKAEGLLKEVQKAPEKFAELARKNSQDPGSASKGGDLDFIARGAMVKSFEDAAFALKKGEISGVVETEFGFHILRLTDVRLPKTKSFDESRATLEADARRQLAQRKFAESAEVFTNMVYEQSDSLAPVAEKLKLDIQHLKGLGREGVADAKSPLHNTKLLAAVFSPDALDNHRNTEAVEVGPNQLVAARVVHHEPARTLPLDEVKASVRTEVVAELSAQRARQEGETKLAEWKANPAAAQLPAAVVVSREQKQQLPNTVVEAALRASTQSLPAWVGVDLGSNGYAVVKVEKVLPRDAAQSVDRSRERAQYAQWWSSAEGLTYYRYLKQKFKVDTKSSGL